MEMTSSHVGMSRFHIGMSFLDNVPNGASTWVTKDGKWLYWPTRGGDAPQRLLRVALK